MRSKNIYQFVLATVRVEASQARVSGAVLSHLLVHPRECGQERKLWDSGRQETSGLAVGCTGRILLHVVPWTPGDHWAEEGSLGQPSSRGQCFPRPLIFSGLIPINPPCWVLGFPGDVGRATSLSWGDMSLAGGSGFTGYGHFLQLRRRT